MKKKTAKNTAKAAPKPKSDQNGTWIALGIIMLIVAVIRIRILGVPLERDEGEFAYMGQLILQGIPPYKIAYNMKFPGIYYMYAFFMSIFGQSSIGVHAGLLIVNLCSIMLLFLLVKKLISNYAAMVAATVFAILSLSIHVIGFAAHATNFVILWALAGTLILFKATTENKNKYYFLSGLLLGFALLMKQHGLFFLIFGGLFLIITSFLNRKYGLKPYVTRFILFVMGGIVPFVVMVIILKIYGVFDRFWFWTIDYAMGFGKHVQLNEAISNIKSTFTPLWIGFYPIWILAGLGLGVLFIHPKLKKDFRIIFILLFFIFSFLSICPGLNFTQHYYITLLPAIAILFSISIDYLLQFVKIFNNRKYLKYTSYALFLISITIAFITQYKYFFQLSPNEISRATYGPNPFPESVEIADYIEANSNKEDKIAIFGSEPQICFYANRHSASRHITTYALMEIHKFNLVMQKEMISDIESAMPKYFVIINIPTSWLVGPNSEKYIFNWIDPFLKKNHYQLKGIADIYADQTIYKWDSEVENYQFRSKCYVLIFRR